MKNAHILLCDLLAVIFRDQGEYHAAVGDELAVAKATADILELREALDTALIEHNNLHREMLRVLEIAESGRVADAIGMLKHALAVSHS